MTTPLHTTGRPPERTPVVYILQDDGTKNLTPARRYGNVIAFAGNDMPLFNQTWVDTLEHWLSPYNPTRDFLLLTGDPVLIGVACAILGKRWDQLSLLKWDRQSKDYTPITLYID